AARGGLLPGAPPLAGLEVGAPLSALLGRALLGEPLGLPPLLLVALEEPAVRREGIRRRRLVAGAVGRRLLALEEQLGAGEAVLRRAPHLDHQPGRRVDPV